MADQYNLIVIAKGKRSHSSQEKFVSGFFAVWILLITTPVFGQLDPLTSKSEFNNIAGRDCQIVFKLLREDHLECNRTVSNPLDSELLGDAFETLRLTSEENQSEHVIQISLALRNQAVTWVQKVWRAHEKLVPSITLDPMVPFSLEQSLKSIKDSALNAEVFTSPKTLMPPISFRVFVHAISDVANPTANPISIARRLIVVPSPSPLSVKAMRQRLALPAALIDEAGSKSTEFFQISVMGQTSFREAFATHDRTVAPSIKEHYEVLAQGSESQIREFNLKLLDKWQKFRTEFDKWPPPTSEFEIKMEKAKRSRSSEYAMDPFAYDSGEGDVERDPYGRQIKKKPKKRDEKFTEQVGKKVDRFLFKGLFQSISRFLGGTSRPAQELIEAEKGFRFLKRELIGDQAKVIEEIFAKQAVLAIDSTSIFLIDGKTALDLAFTQVGCLGIADDLINLDRPENGDDEERETNRANQSTIDQTISFLNELNFQTKQPALPSPPEDPASFPGKLITIYEVALNLLDQVQTDDKYELLAKLQVKLVLALMAEGYAALPNNPQQFNDPEGSAFSPTTIKSAYRLIDAARIDSTFLAAEEERNQWNAKTQSPEFQNSPEVQSYRELKADWESECKIIQSKWDGDYESRIKQWITKRDAMIAYVRSLNNRSEKNLSLKRIEDSVSAIPRIEALAQACEPSEGRPLCLIPSLIAIQSSIEDGRINQGVGPGRIEDRNPFPNSNSNPLGF